MSFFRKRTIISRIAGPVCLAMVFTAIPALSDPSGTGEKLVTNYEILEKISVEAIEELMDNMPSIEEDALILLFKGKGSGAIDEVFTNVLIKRFMEAGKRIATKLPSESDTSGGHDYEFNYQLVRLNIKYPDIDRSYWIGSKRVERLAEIGIFAQLIDASTGDIIWVGETRKNYEDTISYRLLDRVEDPALSYTMPARKELKWGKAVEAVVVTGIVSGLIYLFFSNQDSN
ncbi:MAG TPA: hypothetical protein VLA34_04115 [Candidatus Krumholzibacterium sp.]|nr:hypothetical protein [Candidatus Krumholzibacterium sp.]